VSWWSSRTRIWMLRRFGALSVKTMRGSSHHIVRSTGAFKS